MPVTSSSSRFVFATLRYNSDIRDKHTSINHKEWRSPEVLWAGQSDLTQVPDLSCATAASLAETVHATEVLPCFVSASLKKHLDSFYLVRLYCNVSVAPQNSSRVIGFVRTFPYGTGWSVTLMVCSESFCSPYPRVRSSAVRSSAA